MHYKYKCGDEIIQVFVFNNEFYTKVVVEDNETRNHYKRSIREDKDGKFFTWNRNKIYLNNWIRSSIKNLKEKVDSGKKITTDELTQAIISDGVDKVKFIVPMYDKDVLCKIEETDSIQVKNNYKIILVSNNTDDDGYNTIKIYYMIDIVDLINQGIATIVA